MGNIVDVAKQAGSFKTLTTAIEAAGLASTLSSPGPYTVFAPSDEAFSKLPAGTVENLLKDKAKLAQILTYHVVPGRLMAADVASKPSLKTAEGRSVKIDTRQGVQVQGARVVKPDVLADNGVIHVIDRVILPP